MYAASSCVDIVVGIKISEQSKFVEEKNINLMLSGEQSDLS